MLRISEYIRDTLAGKSARTFGGSILIWNLTNVCNLTCAHCYASAKPVPQEELSFEEIQALIPQIAEQGIKFVIISGGEPLSRGDVFEISQAMRDQGIRTYLSTNGLLINERNIDRIAEHFNYVGISIDGVPEVHDKFRGKVGAHKRSMEAIRLCLSKGIKVGVRFTLTKTTSDSLPYIFELAEKEGIPKIYISHLVYAGRGGQLESLEKEPKREAVQFILDKAFHYLENDIPIDIVTGNNEADAVMLLQEFTQRHPHLAGRLEERLEKWGGNQAGVRMLNINHKGEVKPDPFYSKNVGNVRNRRFDQIWNESQLLKELRNRTVILEGNCGQCKHLSICNGNSRARAQAVSENYWGDDPDCYVD